MIFQLVYVVTLIFIPCVDGFDRDQNIGAFIILPCIVSYDNIAYVFSSYPESHKTNLFVRLFICTKAELTPHLSIDTATITF